MVKNVMLKREIVVSLASRPPTSLYLEQIRNGGRQMKTCAKWFVSRSSRHKVLCSQASAGLRPYPIPKGSSDSGGKAPKLPRTLPLGLIRNRRKQMITCVKCGVSSVIGLCLRPSAMSLEVVKMK